MATETDMPSSPDRPLLTFAIAAFNQEGLITEAVEAAFAQTYSPLEIILSDDCSKDRTFEILTELAAGYQGPHRIVLNRNPVQRCIGGHLNRIVELAKGELILAAAGDDISLPERATITWKAWESSGRKATSIHSSIIQIDESGKVIDEVFKSEGATSSGKFVPQTTELLTYIQTLEPLIFGCAHAFSPKLFKPFGSMIEEVIHEDNALGFRSLIAGQILFIDQPLVRYRVHGNNIYLRNQKRTADLERLRREEQRVRRGINSREIMYRGFLRDIEIAGQSGLLGTGEVSSLRAEALRLHERVLAKREFFDTGFFQKCRILYRLSRQGLDPEEFKLLARRLVPQWLLLRFRFARAYLSSKFSPHA
jgi:glycosyltransferase involved in cell wall biosynthesis